VCIKRLVQPTARDDNQCQPGWPNDHGDKPRTWCRPNGQSVGFGSLTRQASPAWCLKPLGEERIMLKSEGVLGWQQVQSEGDIQWHTSLL
jgi:hypothetical protein